jgi:hypothetical protein
MSSSQHLCVCTRSTLLVAVLILMIISKINKHYDLYDHCFIVQMSSKGRHGRDRMVVGFSTTCVYHHFCFEFEPCSWWLVLDTTLCDKVCWFIGFIVLNTTFNNISFISCGGQFYWRKPDYPKKTTDLSQVTDKLYHIMLYQVLITMNRVRTQNRSDDRHRLLKIQLPYDHDHDGP